MSILPQPHSHLLQQGILVSSWCLTMQLRQFRADLRSDMAAAEEQWYSIVDRPTVQKAVVAPTREQSVSEKQA